jgi:4-hydroxybenzoate polyprenyltransferase
MSLLRLVGRSKSEIVGALYHDPAPVGGVAVALLSGTYGLFGLPVDLPLLVVGFCGVTLIYAADRVWGASPEDRVNRPERVAWVRTHQGWLAVETAGLFAVGGALLPYLEGATLLWTAVLGSVAGLHVRSGAGEQPVLAGLAKPGAIATTWAAGGALLPFVEAGVPVGIGALLFFGSRTLFILPNLLLADWGDRRGDIKAGLAPWAPRWTLRRVRWTATGGLMIAALGALGWAAVARAPVLVGIDAVGLLLMGGTVWGLDPSRPRDAFLADLVVAWPVVPALAAWMIV